MRSKKHWCVYCKGDVSYHSKESNRISVVLEGLSGEFKEDGIVKTILKQRVSKEKELGS